jgi:iron complex outermembrane receptor protein
MKSEKSLSLSAGWRWSKSMFDIDVSLFSHLFKDYIFLTPDTVPMLTIRGFFPVMRYVQTDVALSGSDISLAFRPHQDFEIGAKATLLWGVNLKKQDWLEQLPPHRFQYRVRYQRALSSNINQFYVGLAVNHVLQQTQIPKDNTDYMPPPEGYWLLNFDWGLTADIGKQKIGFGFTIANMLNTVYRDYTNRFRYFTDEAGINISARLKIPLYFH